MASDRDTQALTGVTAVNDSDIICGRGGLALKHPGNMAYRKIVGLNKELYATCLKTEKLRISKSIVAAIRELNGRFLEREDGKTSSSLDEKDENGNPVTWRDIGDKRAIEKTSQALREGQPKLLKKLAQQQENGNGALHAVGPGIVNPMANFNHVGIAPQSQIMPQFGHAQTIQQNNFSQFQGGVQAQTFGIRPPVQNTLQAQQPQHRPSFTLAQMVDGQTFSIFPRNSFVQNNANFSSQSHESWHDSWGSADPAPLPLANGRVYERTNSQISNDSWGEWNPMPHQYDEVAESNTNNPMPLPYHGVADNNTNNDHIFSSDDHQQLMSALGVEGGDGSQNSVESDKSPGEPPAKIVRKRPSVKFQLKATRPSMTAMSLASQLSEMSVFSDALSLDSAIEAAERQAELEMLGELDNGEEMTIGTFSEMSAPKPRRSILRKSNKWMTQNAGFTPPSTGQHVDPGLIFTSTLDTAPGGMNFGTDVSGLMGERRKSVVAFEIEARRRSSRMSLCSALTDFSGVFKRDVGSFLSIQSAEFRELMADLDDDSEDESVEGNAP
mmetsp:Transcript_37600/g.80202  ORF Transcript_37600/g.80202 Transcript_37600/m.80202 type:complete len:555 (+) Transcript_37600:109-1773(+)|eukprot:CAMPEP_0172531274 /NCGR_PEP_ID=MMETSP1067-20121228/4748_1 /TAXON_ID=265564 ORGANISM="Thalassiosira punctigera, Strain Tpunct2005C2" /NCGR_SAMPLE_ID=MMETSP1067 /ASSEMBLY_ACC=CAM_ASM_000444 /LENGTH=554 /DNA_ID=CAMNT_0013315637 /DNA_START=108 /DNA_END=1772 /DNA_ORIENTATION=+